jgi:hypothetical protein
MRRRSSRASRGTDGAATAAEARQAATVAEARHAATVAEAQQAATAAEAQQAVTIVAAITTMAVTASSTSPAPAPAGSSRAAAVEIPDDDVSPPRWDQWASLHTSAPEPKARALVRRGAAA